jgi:glycogen debranching enzyme
MPFKVDIGPPQIAIHHGQTVLVTDLDAQIRWPSERGLFFFDTRVLSSWRIYANGVPWDLLNGGATSYYTSHVYLTNGTILTEDGAIPPRTLGLVVSRSIAGGMHEDLDITNNSMKWVRFQLEIALRSDFADIFEVRSGSIVRRGRITTEWSDSGQQLRTMYRNADFVRSLTVTPEPGQKTAVYANGRLSFEVVLSPGEAWHSCLLYALMDGEQNFAAPHHCVSDSYKLPHAETLAD